MGLLEDASKRYGAEMDVNDDDNDDDIDDDDDDHNAIAAT